jgi:uncharacterized protein YndB with AHSA1/START domain
MQRIGALSIDTQGDREIVITRPFNAKRPLVWDALTKPELMKQWLGVFGGWTLPVCEVDLKAGGGYRYVWRHADGNQMGLRGTFREVIAPERTVSTERFDEAWYPGEALITQTLAESNGKTVLTMTLRYESTAARDGVFTGPMATGLAASFDALAKMVGA